MDQTIINLYDRFTHGGMSRREFLDRLAKLAGSTAAAHVVSWIPITLGVAGGVLTLILLYGLRGER